MIKTANVTGRRTLHFDTPSDLEADVANVVAAARAGRLTQLGNWTPGQSLGHLATWVNFAYDGYPSKPPLFVKLVLGMMKNRFLKGPLPVGRNIPTVPNGTYGTEPLTLDEGLSKFNSAWTRLKSSPPSQPNILFGPLTKEEWTQLHLRHAELHLSFLVPQPRP